MDDWQAGDLALCIKLGPWLSNITSTPRAYPAPRAGEIGTVAEVPRPGSLRLVGYPDGWPFNATRFRKVTPGAEIIGVEEPRRIPAEVS